MIISPVSMAAETAPVVEIVPSSVDLSSEKAEVLIIMRNSSISDLYDVVVKPFNDAGYTIESDPPFSSKQQIISGGDFAWKLKLLKKGMNSQGTIYFQIKYIIDDKNKKKLKITYKSLEVKGHSNEDIVDITMNTTIEALDHQHPGIVYLFVKNKSSQKITVDEISPSGPSFINFCKEDCAQETKAEKLSSGWLSFLSFLKTGSKREGADRSTGIPIKKEVFPNKTEVIPINVKTQASVQPGEYLLIFVTTFKLGNSDSTETRNLAVIKNVKVGVLGETAVLKLLQIPSCIFMPGFLILITWRLLWNLKLSRSKKDTSPFPLEFNQSLLNAEFWVVAITISIVVIALYKKIYNPDILQQYGLGDLVILWVSSVLFLGCGGYYCVLWFVHRRTPSLKDNPVTILKKLHRQGFSIVLNTVKVKDKTDDKESEYKAFLLQPKSYTETVWIGSQILIKAEAKILEQIRKIIDDENDAGKLAKFLEKKGKKVQADWQQSGEGSFFGVKEIKREKIIQEFKDDVKIVTTEVIP